MLVVREQKGSECNVKTIECYKFALSCLSTFRKYNNTN